MTSRRPSGAATPTSPQTAPWSEARELCDEARTILRSKFLAADVGITGANFLIAETGSSIIVTNEGNGDLTQILPQGAHRRWRASIEKVVPTLEDVSTHPAGCSRGRRPARKFSSYTTVSTGPRRPGDLDGPEANTTSSCSTTAARAMLGTEFQDMLRCIRCSALHEPLPGLLTRLAATPMAGSIRARWARC
jgi:L-lactate dehydrogenase complex protein LldF